MSKANHTSPGYRNYVLVILTIVYVFNFIDRQLLVILQESIKSDLGLSDTQLGALTGFTFAIFYVSLGLPIARLADKRNRRNVVAVSLAIWSAMTALSGLVQNFVQLLLARIGVGIGEAGGSPPAHAMISDYFPPKERGRALAIYSTGIYIGVLFGYLLGGYLNDVFGWRTSFIALGVPGVIFAGVLLTTVKEPVRGTFDAVGESRSTTIGEVLRVLLSRRSFILLSLACGFHAFAMYGIGNWMPSILFRLHGMTSTQIGTSLGLIAGIGGAVGIYLGGYLADKLAEGDEKWYMLVPAFGALIGVPFATLAFMSDHTVLALSGMAIKGIAYALYLAPCIAATHNMVPPNMRAFASAILLFVLNIIGLGLGPLLIGLVSDVLTPEYGMIGLRYALLITVVTTSIGFILFLAAARRVKADIRAVQIDGDSLNAN